MNSQESGSYRQAVASGAHFLVMTAAALWGVMPALAQTSGTDPNSQSDQAEETIEEIVVTGTLLKREGFEAPTPTTVIGDIELRQAGRNSVAAVLGDLPQFHFSNNPTTTPNFTFTGSASGELRYLGFERTLSLLNGHRFLATFDLNSIPFAAVERVDVVTGGASATYGSDAVAGVINVLLKDEMDGIEFGAQAGVSTHRDGEEYRFDIAGGREFAGGRGNVLLAVEYFEDEGIDNRTARPQVSEWGTLSNPTFSPANGQAPVLFVQDLGLAVFTTGGLALSGPFAGQQFLPDGSLAPFFPGTIVSGAFGAGGDGPSFQDTIGLKAPLERLNGLAAASFDLTEDITLSADVLYSNVQSANDFVAEFTVSVITADNAFLPDAARTQLIDTGTPFFVFGRYNTDLGLNIIDAERENYQGTLALDGTLGEDFTWTVYYSHGDQRHDEAVRNLRIGANFDQAVDSVIGPGGQPICRVALTDPTTDCVPLNLFGEGAAASTAARDYVMGTTSGRTKATLDVAAATLRGEPFALRAGPVSVALGAEWRKETTKITVDPLSAQQAFSLINFSEFEKSDVSVKEAFGEILVPLVNDTPLLRNLEFNGAARYSDYSTSGGIWSWKLGLTNELFDGLRLRAVRSRDIRAANIVELFSPGGVIVTPVNDPFTTPPSTPIVTVLTGSNPELVPEEADTWTAGLVFEPSFVPGLSLAADFYSIDIAGAITSLDGQQLVDLCFSDAASPACTTIIRGPAPPGGVGPITEIHATLLNLSSFETSGVDMEMSYRTDGLIPGGTTTFRVLANYIDELIFDDGLTRQHLAGDVGPGSPAGPHWRGVASASYAGDRLSIDLRARYVGGGDFNSQPGQETSCDPIGRVTLCPDIADRVYVDLGAQYGLPLGDGESRITLYGSVANVFDRQPPLSPNLSLYDVIGRYYTVGARVNF